MKHASVWTVTLLAAMALAGCVDESDDDEHPPVEPLDRMDDDASYVSVLPSDAQGLEHVATLRKANGDVLAGAGIKAWGDYVFGSGTNEGWWVADISDPTSPQLVFHDTELTTAYTRDLDLVFHENGRVSLAIASQGDGMHFWDVTDPTQPEWLSFADVNLNHNLATVPGTEYVFNSNHRAHVDDARRNELVDARDASHPVVVGTFGAYGCHHHYFWTDPATGDVALGACAGIEAAEIWDMRGFDPAAQDFGIRVLATIEGGTLQSPVQGNLLFSRDPLFEWHHSAFISDDGQTLVLGSETNGASSPGGCLVYVDETGASTPLGALWFYDISDPTAPQLLDWVSPAAPEYLTEPAILEGYEPVEYLTGGARGCNSHFGDFVEGQDKMVVGWFTAGTVLIDFSDPSDVRILESHRNRKPDYSDAQSTWDAWEHGGYVYTGDTDRGMDVLRLV